jgi:hypothetical protein
MMKYSGMLLAVIIVLIGCSLRSEQNSSEVTPQDNLTPGLTNFGPAELRTIPPSFDLETNCISTTPPLSATHIDGTIVFLDPQSPRIVSKGESEFRIPIGPSDRSVSPGNEHMIYQQIIDGNPGNASVIAANGTLINELKREFVGGLPGGDWISDEYVRYLSGGETDGEQIKLNVLNIRTGEIRELRTDFPDLASGNQQGWRMDNAAMYYRNEGVVNLIYDPSLGRVAYPKQGSSISLYDVVNDAELASIQVAGYGDPGWSSDGQYFSFKAEDPLTQVPAIYIIPRSGGEISALVNLAERHPGAVYGSYSWSPDSRQIAFWAKTTDEFGFADSLFISNLATSKTSDVCVSGLGSWGSIKAAGLADLGVSSPSATGQNFVLAGKPVWSPDGNKLLIARYDTEKQEVVDIVIDLDNNIAYLIAVDLEPMGWMK